MMIILWFLTTVLTFDEVLARASKAHVVSQDALDAAHQLETPRRSLPSVRLETAASSAEDVNVFAQNVLHFQAVTMLLSADYPLFDGGLRDAQLRAAKLDAAEFRERVRASHEERYREAVDAVARLYLAQERLRILDAALQRASGMRERAQQLMRVREISNTTAAQWEEQALRAESQRLELELERLDAEGRVKQLIGDESAETIAIDLGNAGVPAGWPAGVSPARGGEDAAGPAAETAALQRMRVALEEAQAARRPQVMLSAFGGVAALGDAYAFNGRQRYGIYGIRMTLGLPMFDAATARRVAQAKLQTEEAEIAHRDAVEREQREKSSASLAMTTLQKRIDLLTQAVDVARQREASVARLVAGGIRSESDAADAAMERTRRESDVLAARVDLWKLAHLAGR